MYRAISFAAALVVVSPAMASEELTPFEVGMHSGLAIFCDYEPFGHRSQVTTISEDYLKQETGHTLESAQELDSIQEMRGKISEMREMNEAFGDGLDTSIGIIKESGLRVDDCDTQEARNKILLEQRSTTLKDYFGYSQ